MAKKKISKGSAKRTRTTIYLLPLNATDAEIDVVVDKLVASQKTARNRKRAT